VRLPKTEAKARPDGPVADASEIHQIQHCKQDEEQNVGKPHAVLYEEDLMLFFDYTFTPFDVNGISRPRVRQKTGIPGMHGINPGLFQPKMIWYLA